MQQLVGEMAGKMVMGQLSQEEAHLDEMLNKLDNMDTDDMEKLREARKRRMIAEAKRKQQLRAQGHGEYREISGEKEFFREIKNAPAAAVHFTVRRRSDVLLWTDTCRAAPRNTSTANLSKLMQRNALTSVRSCTSGASLRLSSSRMARRNTRVWDSMISVGKMTFLMKPSSTSWATRGCLSILAIIRRKSVTRGELERTASKNLPFASVRIQILT